MSFLLAICLYLRLRGLNTVNHIEDTINNNNIMNSDVLNKNLTVSEWNKLVNHPFNENEW